MVATVIPVGQFLGAMELPAEADSEPGVSYRVRLGVNIEELDESELGVWALAHGVGPDVKQVSLPALESLAVNRAKIPDSREVADRLLRRGLLARVVPVGAEARQFAERHQLMPLGVGLGNSPNDLTNFGIGQLDFPRSKVGAALFDTWAFAATTPSLWHACEQAETVADDVAPGDVLRLVLEALPVLLATDAAWVDLSPVGVLGAAAVRG